MGKFVQTGDYGDLEAEYRDLCRRLAGEDVAREIDSLPFDRYEDSLDAGLQVALASLQGNGGRCIFFRVGTGDWSGSFGVQANHPGIHEPFDECSYQTPVAEFVVAPFEGAARIDARQPLYTGTRPSGASLFLRARTVAAFGRCVNASRPPVPVYFSCMLRHGLTHHPQMRTLGRTYKGSTGYDHRHRDRSAQAALQASGRRVRLA